VKSRDYAYCGLFSGLALALPALFHALGLAGALFLPMYWPLVTLAFLASTRRAVLAAALVPWAAAVLTGMPLLWPPLAATMSVELAVQVALLGAFGPPRGACGRSTGRVFATLLVVLTLGRFLHAGLVWALAQAFALPASVLAGASWFMGWPGVVLMLVFVPAFVGSVTRTDGVCEVRFLKALRRLRLPERLVLLAAQVLRWFETLAREAEQLARATELRTVAPPRGAADASGPPVVVRDLTVRYPGASEPALAHVDFRVAPGEKVALLGPNGAGKTTLLSALAGFVPNGGAVRVFGSAPDSAAARGRLGLLFENPDDQFLYPTLREDVGYALVRRGVAPAAASARVDALLAAVGLPAGNRPLASLSRGQRQRAALAGLLAAEPALLLLDEPTAALDEGEKARLADLLAVHPAAIVLSTHDRAFADRVCTRKVVLG